jgi:NAD-dependent SIR2 family protein deacetylase
MTIIEPWECDHCGGAVAQEDSYRHDGMVVKIHRCTDCETEGTLVFHPDGHTSGRGCLAEQADEKIHTLGEEFRALRDRLSGVLEGLR